MDVDGVAIVTVGTIHTTAARQATDSVFIVFTYVGDLLRSGLIASVHSFAKSDIGPFFSWFLLFLLITSAALVVCDNSVPFSRLSR